MPRRQYNLRRVAEWFPLARRAHYDAARAAELCHVSPRQLQRYCQRRFGRSAQDWLNEQRIIAAAHMLSECLPIKRVVLELNFKQHSFFTRQFKSFYGLTPTEYIEQRLRFRFPEPLPPEEPVKKQRPGR